ncbi:MAG: magnesium-translocating P-type ATPase [Candidatus Rokuibacteriota bacterium]|nr:MAG: magnesium-translocating P-type ATPase [Candidatus Rokubacteria bacterium]
MTVPHGPVDALLAELHASRRGLTADEARRRLGEVGPNEPARAPRTAGLVQILLLLANPLVIILLIASLASAVLGERVNASIIVLMVALSVALNFVQTYRSHRVAERLRDAVAPTATALRDGTWSEIRRRELVPGDIVRLAAGDRVPADARLLEARDLHVQQAALTGESMPAEKDAGDIEVAPRQPADARNVVFLGTSVVSGTATALVVATGPATAFGDIAARLSMRPPETEFERGTRQFALLIMRTVFFLVLFVLLAGALLHHAFLESLLFAVALAVGLTPEFLPMISAVTLSRGAAHMARQKVIVKHLEAIENFGSMDVLCSDKTGTLTSGDMMLDRHLDPFGQVSERPFTLAYVNSSHQTGIKSPLDEAILKRGGAGISGYRKIDEIPFDFERRRLSVVVENSGGRLLITKGAPEGVIACCTTYEVDDRRAALDEATRARCEATYRELSAQGSRVLAVAYAVAPLQAMYSARDECELVLAGFVTFFDPPMEGVAETLRALRRDGVVVKILTGDNELVAQHVCGQVGLDSARIVGGDEIERMTDSALAAVAEHTTVFARVSPAQKNRIILALKSRNHVVGFLGDGINDAPSIHTADVGVSVATAVDVAKDAADIILLERDLDVLHAGILEGRRAFGNVMKYLLMGTSSNFGNMFSMAGAFLFLPFLPMLPTQILLNNFLYDLAQITIPSDNVDDAFIRTPQRWNIGIIQRFMVVIGPISSIYDFLTFGVLLWVFRASEALFQTGWFVESLATQTLVLFVIRTAGSPLRSRPSLPLAVTTVLVVLIGVILPFTPLAATLGLVPLPGAYFVFLGGVTMTYLVLVEVVKRRLMRKLLGMGPATPATESVTPAT